MAGHKNFNELIEKLSPERRAAVNKRFKELIKQIEEEQKEKRDTDKHIDS